MHNQVSRDAYLRKQTVNILSAAKRSSHFRRQIFTKVRVNGAYSYFQNSTEAFSIIFKLLQGLISSDTPLSVSNASWDSYLSSSHKDEH